MNHYQHSIFHEEKTAVEYEDTALESVSAIHPEQQHRADELQHKIVPTPSPSIVSIVIDENGNMRRSLLLKNAFQVGTPYDISTERRKQSKCNSICCHQVMSYLKTKMAFKAVVADDPRLFSPTKKKLILAALALGASLNGFCSTVYVSFDNITSYLLSYQP
jgi:hypothetical protein